MIGVCDFKKIFHRLSDRAHAKEHLVSVHQAKHLRSFCNEPAAKSSEWVSDGEMQALAVLETAHIVEASLVGHMQADAPVEADHEEVHIVA